MPPARKVPKLHKKTVSIKNGTKFTDLYKQEFIIGKEIGQGGFGRIYEGIQTGSKTSVAIKVEPSDNGPLFTEMHVYQRILKLQMLENWKQEKGIKFLGLPNYISAGQFDYEGAVIRYLVMPKFATTLESIRESRGTFTLAETLAVARTVLNALAYLHDQNHVHGDVKASNLMVASQGRTSSKTAVDFTKVVLIDFGLARKLPDAIIEKENKKQAHNGTPLFTSCDAHRGCLPSFRGDLEILTHNMLYWMAGTLPWKEFENDLEKVYQLKKTFVANARREVPKVLARMPEKEAKRAAAIITESYSASIAMDFGDKIDLARMQHLFGPPTTTTTAGTSGAK